MESFNYYYSRKDVDTFFLFLLIRMSWINPVISEPDDYIRKDGYMLS